MNGELALSTSLFVGWLASYVGQSEVPASTTTVLLRFSRKYQSNIRTILNVGAARTHRSYAYPLHSLFVKKQIDGIRGRALPGFKFFMTGYYQVQVLGCHYWVFFGRWIRDLQNPVVPDTRCISYGCHPCKKVAKQKALDHLSNLSLLFFFEVQDIPCAQHLLFSSKNLVEMHWGSEVEFLRCPKKVFHKQSTKKKSIKPPPDPLIPSQKNPLFFSGERIWGCGQKKSFRTTQH